MAFLDSKGFVGVTDRVVEGGDCGKERPDRVLDFGDKIVIVECDEDQHKGRQCLCEQARMVNIGQSFGGLPVYFIRFNPDEYKGGDEPLTNRYKMLALVLKGIKDGIDLPKALTSVMYMYYDGSVGSAWDALTS
jgi:hypothetical protein